MPPQTTMASATVQPAAASDLHKITKEDLDRPTSIVEPAAATRVSPTEIVSKRVSEAASDVVHEEIPATQPAKSPRSHITSAPINTDSMVSVQLSEPMSARSSVQSVVTPVVAQHDILADAAFPHRRISSTVEVVHDANGAQTINQTPSVPATHTYHRRTSSLRKSVLSPPQSHTDTAHSSIEEAEDEAETTDFEDDEEAISEFGSKRSRNTSMRSSSKNLATEIDWEGTEDPLETEFDTEIHAPAAQTHLHLDTAVSAPNALEREDEVQESGSLTSPGDPEIIIHSADSREAMERSFARSMSFASEQESDHAVDWEQLDKTEKSEEKDEVSDESTAFLLARLEQENNALAADHRFGSTTTPTSTRRHPRPPSLQVLKRLVSDPNGISTRYSVLPSPPPMTELEFWAALVKDYPQTAQRLPTLTSNKIKGGVPPPLRGVVWVSMVGARDSELGDQFDKLSTESSPYDSIIGKDIGRSFPGVEMFKDPNGDGQQMLGRVLKCFSLYDKEIGYCQGLGFLVGPLLMQMGDKDAFCVLVRLMENYDLRSCFRPDLSGLHLRIFQFQRLLTQHLPNLAAHLSSLQVEAAYLSQWFLSFFAVTCPLPMLFRIYDVIFAEGASETIMRVAMSLMKRNEEKLMAHTEFEEVMQLLLSRSLWDTYASNADDLVNDFSAFTGMVTRESLQKLEQQFKEASGADTLARFAFFSDATSAASQFLGRLWTASRTKPNLLGPAATPAGKAPALRRSPSKSSLASTTHSHSEATDSIGTMGTDPTNMSRDSAADLLSLHSKTGSIIPGAGVSKEDKDLHSQIEDLLTALSDMQRDQSILAEQLQKEREDRSEDHQVFSELVSRLRDEAAPAKTAPTTKDERRQTLPPHLAKAPSLQILSSQLGDIVERVDFRLQAHKDLRRASMLETKQRLRETLNRTKEQLGVESSRSADLSQRLDQQEREANGLRDQLKDARARIQEGFAERNRLQSTILEYRARERESFAWSDTEAAPVLYRSDTDQSRASISSATSISNQSAPNSAKQSGGGLREFRLSRVPTSPVVQHPGIQHAAQGSIHSHPARGSSLATKQILSTTDHKPASEEDMLVELVNAKTAEAQAKHELEELRSKFDAMRRMLGMPPSSGLSPTPTPSTLPGNPFTGAGSAAVAQSLSNLSTSMSNFFHRPSASETTVVPAPHTAGSTSSQVSSSTVSEASTPARQNSNDDRTNAGAAAAGGFWSSWAKRSVSGVNPATLPPATAAAVAAAEKTAVATPEKL